MLSERQRRTILSVDNQRKGGRRSSSSFVVMGACTTVMLLVMAYSFWAEQALVNNYYHFSASSLSSVRFLETSSSMTASVVENNDATNDRTPSSVTKLENKNDFEDSSTMTATEAIGSISSSSTSIRRWGCAARTETPSIFVHVGKAGGGSVRARFAAAALNFNRTSKQWHDHSDTTAYYPISITPTAASRKDEDHADNNTESLNHVRGYFCNQGSHSYRYVDGKAHEGIWLCAAQSPLGQAIACPMTLQHYRAQKCHECDFEGETCHRVYVGHNVLGNEMHWLPYKYLQKWWGDNEHNGLPLKSQEDDNMSRYSQLARQWELLHTNNTSWCPSFQQPRPAMNKLLFENYKQCTVPLAEKVDRMAYGWMQQLEHRGQQQVSSRSVGRDLAKRAGQLEWPAEMIDPTTNWGPLYASLPLLRTTVVRDPFSWLLSKFHWHPEIKKKHKCGNVTGATAVDGHWRFDIHEDVLPGWAHRLAMEYIHYLCGEDCHVRYEMALTRLGSNFTEQHARLLLDAAEQQSDYNLRNSFAVVGLNENIDEFYDMVSARVQYLNMSRNSHIVGKRHSSGVTEECKVIFRDVQFQQQLIEGSPAIAAMQRLYQTALKVNAFQKQELQSCGSMATQK